MLVAVPVWREVWRVLGYQVIPFNMATGGASAQTSTEEDATELQFPKGLN